jgi:FHA domain-containing protein
VTSCGVVVPKQGNPRAEESRRPARDLISAVLENMRRNLEPLKYSTLAPSRYLVYLHPTEYARLEGIIPILQEQTIRALAEELDALNRRSTIRRYAERILGDRDAPVQNAGEEWHVDFLPDPDGDIAEGDILIDSELLLPASPELGVGDRTRRIATVHSFSAVASPNAKAEGQRTTTRERTIDRSQESAFAEASADKSSPARVFARIVYEDNAGHHSYDVVKDSVTIGRGGITYPVDIKIMSSVDVSREHARIRRDPQTGRFFLIDLSSLGMTLNDRHIPRGYDEVDGSKRENGTETPLPDRARIGLAETVYLNFGLVR